METLGVLLFVIGLLLSIALHELGHLLPAKRFGVPVTQYMVGFGPTVWSRTRGGTEYGIKAIPLGGYIRMVGMFPPGNAESDSSGRFATLIATARAESRKEVPGQATGTPFYSLSVPRKLAVMAGGPLMNLVLAGVLFTLALSVVGVATPRPTVSSIVPCTPSAANPTGIASNDGGCGDGDASPAALAGLQPGDVVVSVADQPITQWQDIGSALVGHAGQRVVVVVSRGGSDLRLPADLVQIQDSRGMSRAFLGISPTFTLQTVPTAEALRQLAAMGSESVRHLATFPAQVGRLAIGLVTGQERDPAGPVSVLGVGRISGEIAAAPGVAARDKLSSYLGLLASLNLFLFLFNLVPLLPLDGGHIAGALYEGARRSVARLRGRSPTGPVDTAKMLPLAYAVSVALLLMSLVVMISDIVDPITLR